MATSLSLTKFSKQAEICPRPATRLIVIEPEGVGKLTKVEPGNAKNPQIPV